MHGGGDVVSGVRHGGGSLHDFVAEIMPAPLFRYRQLLYQTRRCRRQRSCAPGEGYKGLPKFLEGWNGLIFPATWHACSWTSPDAPPCLSGRLALTPTWRHFQTVGHDLLLLGACVDTSYRKHPISAGHHETMGHLAYSSGKESKILQFQYLRIYWAPSRARRLARPQRRSALPATCFSSGRTSLGCY